MSAQTAIQKTAVQKPISPLRQRMLDEMALRAFTDKTQSDYIRHVWTFTAFIRRSPDTATSDDLRAFQAHLRQTGVQPPTMNSTVSALRFFFKYACDQPDLGRFLRIVKQAQKLPIVLTQEEAARLMEAAPGPKYKAVFGTAYGAGLRVSEVANLKVSDIDSTRMLLRVEQGKGAKDRNAMLSPRLLQLLREWWLVQRPTTWLFPGRDPVLAMSPRQIYRVVCDTASAIGIDTRSWPTTAAATGIVPSARARRHGSGWRIGRPNCCLSRTSIASSRYRPRSATSPTPTRPSSTMRCSRRAARRC